MFERLKKLFSKPEVKRAPTFGSVRYSTAKLEVMYGEGVACFGGDMVISRYFYDPKTKDWIHLEAHEVCNTNEIQEDGPDGSWRIATWLADGNDGGPWNCDTDEMLRFMLEFVPPAGMEEREIPAEVFQ